MWKFFNNKNTPNQMIIKFTNTIKKGLGSHKIFDTIFHVNKMGKVS